MVGSAIHRNLLNKRYTNIVTQTSSELDLRDQSAVNAFFRKERPEYVFLAAAKVGGIHANNVYRADFLYENLSIQNNVIHASYSNEVKKLMFLGSSCIYPKLAPQPLKEDYLLTGPLEPTNEPYAIAKIAGIKLCEAYRDQYGCNFISVMPTNLYGPNDNYDPQKSHVLPALIRKFFTAVHENLPFVELWGDGTPKREFLHVDDLAEACVFLMKTYNGRDFINIGWGEDVTIRELAEMIASISGFQGEIRFDVSKPNGTPRKLMDVSRLTALGFRPRITLMEGLREVYKDFSQNQAQYIS